MPETKLRQRDNSECLINTAELLRRLKQKAEDAEWQVPPHPAAHRFREEYEMMRKKYGEGETLTPKF